MGRVRRPSTRRSRSAASSEAPGAAAPPPDASSCETTNSSTSLLFASLPPRSRAVTHTVTLPVGIPSVSHCSVQGAPVTVPSADREDFFRTQFLYWLLCAIDGHAKNFSVFIEPEGRFRLTPRYDVLSAYPVLGRRQNQLSPHKVKMAMAVHATNRHYRWREIHVEHWLQTGRRCGLPHAGRRLLEDVLERAPDALLAVEDRVPAGFPESVSAPILAGLGNAVTKARRALR